MEEYALMMERGSPAPAVILIAKRNRYVVLDGVQRLSAAELFDCTSAAAYVLNSKTSPQKEHIVRITANARINGQHTPDKHFMLEQAVKILYGQDGLSESEIAKALARSVEDVRKEIRYQKTSMLMKQAGYAGKLVGRKWFAATLGKYAQADDWSKAPAPLKAMCETMEECKFRNGESEHLIESFFEVKRVARKDRHAQFTMKMNELRSHPEVRRRLSGKSSKTPIEKLMPSLRGAATVVQQIVDRKLMIVDNEFAAHVAEVLREIYVGLKKATPHDVQYSGNRRSSIYDKG